MNCLTNGTSIEIQPVLLDLLGCVAAVSEEKFAPYYSSFMPGEPSLPSSLSIVTTTATTTATTTTTSVSTTTTTTTTSSDDCNTHTTFTSSPSTTR